MCGMEPQPHKDLKTLIAETLELKNVSLEKLSEATGISERYLWAIQNVEIDKLPATPYVRGYIKKISEVLDLNHDELWELYKKELEKKQSGTGTFDTLPQNRFAIKHIPKKIFIIAFVAILAIFYIGFNLGRLTGRPSLTIAYPNEEIVISYENTVMLNGKLDQRDKLTINNEEIYVNFDKTFSKSFTLQPGLNKIEFKAKRFLGKEVVINRQIIYQPTVKK